MILQTGLKVKVKGGEECLGLCIFKGDIPSKDFS